MYLFFDTETTGLKRNSDHVVQVAWILADRSGNVVSEECHVIEPDGYSIPWGAAQIHGITTAIAADIGKPLKSVLKYLSASASLASVAVAHNLSFDLGILQGDYDRVGLDFPFHGKTQVCTMKLSTTWCRLPKLNASPGFKYPKLEELHYRLFGEAFDDAHDALADTQACMRCYFELVRIGVISPPEFQNDTPPKSGTQSVKLVEVIHREGSYSRSDNPMSDAEASARERWGLNYRHCTVCGAHYGSFTNQPCSSCIQPAEKPSPAPPKENAPPSQPTSTSSASNFPKWVDQRHIEAIVSIGYRIPEHSVSAAEFMVLRPDKSGIVVRALSTWVDILHEVVGKVESGKLGAVAYLLARLSDAEKEIEQLAQDMDEACAQVDDLESTIEQLEEEKAALGVRLPDTSNPTATTSSDSKAVASPEVPDSVVKQFSRDDHFRLKAESSDPNERAAVAANPECPVEILLKLATDTDVDVLIALGSNSSDPEDAFSKIASTADKGALHEICFRSTTRPESLHAIAFEHGQDSVLAATLALNPNTSGYALAHIGLIHSANEICSKVLTNPSFNDRDCADYLDSFVSHNDQDVRALIAESPICPADILEQLYADNSDEVRLAVAKNPKSPPLLLIHISTSDSDEDVREAALENPSNSIASASAADATADTLSALSTNISREVREAVAANKNCTQSLLENLRHDEAPEVRFAAVSRGSIAPGEIARLADDPHPPIRKFIVQRESTSTTVLERASRDSTVSVRLAVAKHLRVAQSALEHLANDADENIRKAVARHRNAPETALLRLANDPDGVVRMVVARRSQLPDVVMRNIAHSRFFEYRRMVALNPSCPPDLLEKLAADPEPDVSKAAKKRLARPSTPTSDTGQP